MRHFLVFCLGFLFLYSPSTAQTPKKYTSSDTYHLLQKLNFLGSALYIAAHPDDENTRLISYLSNNLNARTGYLSVTRGDGGQNLIGTELRELLGVLRTEELLAARRVDGGEQFFTRANDFGYSKHPKETLQIWDKEKVLGDVVWVIRNFKPDVIINRFDHRTPGSTHGHHTSSAILSVEAFDLVKNPEAYPEQLDYTDPWEPKRLFFNTSWWFYGSQENFEKADKSRLLSMDIGIYYPMLGRSNNEIASLASSQHLSQGFGRLSTRGSQPEYIELLRGSLPENKDDLFEGIDTSWSRIPGGEAIGEILYAVEAEFNFVDPSTHLPDLTRAYSLLQKLEDSHWKKIKSKELQELIAAVSGLYLEASAQASIANPGTEIEVNVEALNRSNASITLQSVSYSDYATENKATPLLNNQKLEFTTTVNIPTSASYTSPYWLEKKGTLGMYKVEDPLLIGKPETPPALEAKFLLSINDKEIPITRSVIHRYAKPDKGELYEPFEILPEVTAGFKDKVVIFADGTPREIPITITAHKDNVSGEIELCYDDSWKVENPELKFSILNKGESQTVFFSLTPPEGENESYISPILKINGKTLTHEMFTIPYQHIPKQSVLLPSEAKVVRLDIQKAGQHIGYIEGAGDQIPESLEQIGYTVHKIDPASIQIGSLDRYDAVVVGIRAYNVVEELQFKQPILFKYVEDGGNLILQYNTAGRRDSRFNNLAPYPLKLSRDRVTDENSNVDIIAKNNALVNFPNKIEPEDFEGWVQERGLYFPSEWDERFTPVLSMSDNGESPKKGSLLVTQYGKGNYIYTGLSFFRELPAGVPGAYKLFANMLSIGKEKIENKSDIKG